MTPHAALTLALALTPSAPPAEAAAYTARVRPLLQAYCVRCHGPDQQEGGVEYASIADDAAALGKRGLWRRAKKRVEAGDMPPREDGVKQPTAAERAELQRWLGFASAYLDCDPARRDPGPPPLRRLTHAEYARTVGDLLGVSVDPRGELGFPAEEADETHFANLSAGLSLTPTLADRYFAAADKIADAVFQDNNRRNRLVNPRPGPTLPERDAARQVLTTLARRGYRQAPDAADVDRLLGFYDRARAGGGTFDDGVRAAIKPVLVSPRFLFRFEEDRPAIGPAPGVPVDGYELAVRLSYFFWGSMPDDELFRAAAAGHLADPAALDGQVARMLKHDRSRHLTDTLANEWLGLRHLPRARPTQEFFPEYDGEVRRAMRDEVPLFLNHVRAADRPVTDLLDADYTFANARLAKFYGLQGVAGNQMRKVDLKPEHHRGGVLGMGAVLAMTSHTFRTSPTQRGKYVLATLLGDPPPPPPANAGQIAEDDPKRPRAAAATFREKLAQHAAQPSCAGCHNRIDPLGFALDNFNAVGAWREQAAGAPLDVSGVLPGGTRVNGYADLKKVLLARKDEFARTMIAKTLEYALGRELDGQDECTVDDVLAAMKRNDYRFSVMVAEVVRSVPFRQRRAAEK